MARILALDYGTKKTGIAVTDPLQIIASPLTTIPTTSLFEWLETYLQEEEVEKIVVGEPLNDDGSPAKIHHLVVGVVRQLRKQYPELPIVWQDERYSSQDARAIILRSGTKKMKRRDKTLVDKVAAVLILQDYLGHRV